MYPSNTEPVYSESSEDTLKKILKALHDAGTGDVPLATTGGGAGAPIYWNYGSVTAGSFSIPSGSRGWAAMVISGTGSIGSFAGGVGLSDSDSATLFGNIGLTADADSVIAYRYGTDSV